MKTLLRRPSLRDVLGSLRILRRRADEVGQPGLATWARAGEAAAVQIADTVRSDAYSAETRALSLAQELEAITADGVITRDELGRLRTQLAPSARRIADTCHTLGETVA